MGWIVPKEVCGNIVKRCLRASDGLSLCLNLRYLAEKNCRFIMALPGSLKYCRELIDKHRDEIVNKSECYLGPDKPYGRAYDVNELGFRMRVHVYYDPDKAAHDGRLLHEEIAKTENELAEMTEPPARSLHHDRYFFINRSSKDGSLSYRRNPAAIDKALSQCGFFLIAETDFKKRRRRFLTSIAVVVWSKRVLTI